QGLEIVPVAFERTDDFQTSAISLERYLSELNLPYEGYIGGRANKALASEAFPMLSKIISYPTSIYIDKTGTIRKVHTGFYGPGTGMYYERYKVSTNKFIQELLNE
ncbi:MAG: TlpA family protein disulfide reductase, partial [Flavobacteriales bacterium]